MNAGDELQLRLARPPFGDWAWRLRLGDRIRQGTTFFGRPPQAMIAAARTGARPVHSRRSEAVAFVIESMDGQRVAEIVTRVIENYPDLWPTRDRAERFVAAVVRAHGRAEHRPMT